MLTKWKIGIFKAVSTYKDCSTGKCVFMQKAKGADGEPFWSL